MIEHKQLYKHDPKNGIYGDCFRTSIACILDMNPLDVPHWYAELWPPGVINAEIADLVRVELIKWLGQFGLSYVELPITASDNETLFQFLRGYFPPDVYIALGCSSKNGGHSVVVNSTGYIWDPAIDNSGCVGPMSDGFYWVGMIIKK